MRIVSFNSRIVRRKAGFKLRGRGRPRLVSDEGIRRLVEEAKARDFQQNSFTHVSLRDRFIQIAREEAVADGRNPDLISTPHANTMTAYRKEIVPRTVQTPSVQNTRRLEVSQNLMKNNRLLTPQVGMDPRNQMTLAIVVGALIGDPTEGFDPKLFLNSDVTTLLLQDANEVALLAEGSLEVLGQERKSASITRDGHKARSISLLVTVNAAGQLVCTVGIIKDSNFKEQKIYEVCYHKRTLIGWGV